MQYLLKYLTNQCSFHKYLIFSKLQNYGFIFLFRSFLALIFKCSSVTHELPSMFLYMLQGRAQDWLHHYTLTHFSQTICVKGLFSCTVLKLLSKLNCSYAYQFALVSDSESLICSSVLTLLLYTLDYYSIIARLAVNKHWFTNFVFILYFILALSLHSFLLL